MYSTLLRRNLSHPGFITEIRTSRFSEKSTRSQAGVLVLGVTSSVVKPPVRDRAVHCLAIVGFAFNVLVLVHLGKPGVELGVSSPGINAVELMGESEGVKSGEKLWVAVLALVPGVLSESPFSDTANQQLVMRKVNMADL